MSEFKFSISPLSERNDVLSFCCQNKDLNDFLKNDALGNQEQLISKTYVCYYQKDFAGYFTLTTDTMKVKYIDDSDCVDGFPYSRYPAVKIARLATDKRFEGRGIGSYMLFAAIGLAQRVADLTGCRYITVDSKPESIGFYTKYGFKIVKTSLKKDYTSLYLNMQPMVKGI
ncbi:MAG: GNAT family N-acetyltransferase [Methanolobus sp.]|jgi:GNAT superfamily N-acetyltransferase|nr:GNAT family N-acetyltransferase [Methanolobus sp.]